MPYRTQPTSVRSIFDGIIDSKRTEYRGITMRSRLEADFARHLDELGVEWRYEPVIFGPRGQGYLPDFRVDRPESSDFIEVKPTLREVPAAKLRMEVIWETYPDAALIVACAEGSRFFAAVAGGEWTSWTDLWRHR